jgi:hypothetical protein
MVGANSPAIACRHGLSFVRMLKARFEEFQGDRKVNFWIHFNRQGWWSCQSVGICRQLFGPWTHLQKDIPSPDSVP